MSPLEEQALVLWMAVVALILLVEQGIIDLWTRAIANRKSVLVTTKISLDRDGVVKIDSVGGPGMAKALEKTDPSVVVGAGGSYTTGLAAIVGSLVVLEITRWIWWLCFFYILAVPFTPVTISWQKSMTEPFRWYIWGF